MYCDQSNVLGESICCNLLPRKRQGRSKWDCGAGLEISKVQAQLAQAASILPDHNLPELGGIELTGMNAFRQRQFRGFKF